MMNMKGHALLDADAISQIVPVHHETIKRWVLAGKFPAPVKIFRRSFWRADEIRAWMDGLSPDRDTSAEATVVAAALVAADTGVDIVEAA